jgi:cytidine deaminase
MMTNRQIERLAKAALRARRQAYAPYSRFRVGAAVATRSGKVYTGCNVENASYGATICAERVAITKAVSEGHRRLTAVAIATGGKHPAPPCGICLQFMTEFAEDMPVILVTSGSNEIEVTSLGSLLTYHFKL